LVDALRSGRSGSTPVGVQIPPSAPIFKPHVFQQNSQTKADLIPAMN
jgi:hypothetical protein